MAELEREEIREIYAKKGFANELLDEIVRVITARKKVWIDTMMKEELGLMEDGRSPLHTAISTGVGFVLIGMIPLFPFIFLHVAGMQISVSQSFLYSVGFNSGAFFLIGIIKGKIVKKSLLRSGLITLLIGGIAATVAYLVGHALSTIIR